MVDLLYYVAAIVWFALIEGGRLQNLVVQEALPTAASLVSVFDEAPSGKEATLKKTLI
jgi:uncharacterized membrane protein